MGRIVEGFPPVGRSCQVVGGTISLPTKERWRGSWKDFPRGWWLYCPARSFAPKVLTAANRGRIYPRQGAPAVYGGRNSPHKGPPLVPMVEEIPPKCQARQRNGGRISPASAGLSGHHRHQTKRGVRAEGRVRRRHDGFLWRSDPFKRIVEAFRDAKRANGCASARRCPYGGVWPTQTNRWRSRFRPWAARMVEEFPPVGSRVSCHEVPVAVNRRR